MSKTATCGTSGKRALRLLDRAQRRRVVQRRKRLELLDLGPNLVVDHDRLAEPRAAVHHAVRDTADMSQGLSPGRDLPGLVAFDDVQLQARRARVDD